MLVLLILIFMTAANQHNFARASGFCGPPQIAYTVPVHETYPINKIIRLQCVEGYVRKAGTSNQIRCTEKDGEKFWEYILNFECIPDPRKPNVPKTDPTTPHVTKKTQMPHFTSSTTESTDIKISTVLGTSMPTTATGHLTLTTTNEVVTTKTRRTTSQPTLKSTTKEAESITTTNEITSSTSSSFTSRDYMTATSSHSSSSSFTTITEVKGFSHDGVNVSVKTTNVSEETKMEATFSNYTSTVSGVTSIIIICLAAAVFLLWWRWRHRERSDRNGIQLYHNVCTSEHCSTDPNTAANNPTTVSVNDTNQPHTGSLNGVDTSDKLLPQTDSC
ncbi:interleukin-15 receptor subunit alpha isoform X2 [Megalobrama amblycephala]|uniref:interleukin-15 receptor subunit alpha isoform X2 n=1 Tax=Megalobrama amblycephala TaxID=75352 RepID=UPI0020146A12|nr:interleukin-15 receptor subunit alpha isoform X2 [Megalobrama amblycephala]